tara:strand:- start:663 stop:1070 length:408 start_codon:yes stop_codon:yes gene_type:complete
MESPSLKLDFLKEAPHYLSHIDNTQSRNVGYNFLAFIKDNFELNVASIFITNYKKPSRSDLMYILRLEREQVILYEKTDQVENNIEYSFIDDSIFLNKKSMSAFYNNSFKKRLTEIIRDLKQNKCSIFEEIIEPE